MLLFAALSSALGYLEPISTTISELFKISRAKGVWIALSLIFVASVPPIMAHGPWQNIKLLGRNFFDFADYLSGNIAMPLGAIVLIFFAIFKWKFEGFKEDINNGATTIKINSLWKPVVLGLIPISLVIIFVMGIGIF